MSGSFISLTRKIDVPSVPPCSMTLEVQLFVAAVPGAVRCFSESLREVPAYLQACGQDHRFPNLPGLPLHQPRFVRARLNALQDSLHVEDHAREQPAYQQ